jgi:hypothetical protein
MSANKRGKEEKKFESCKISKHKKDDFEEQEVIKSEEDEEDNYEEENDEEENNQYETEKDKLKREIQNNSKWSKEQSENNTRINLIEWFHKNNYPDLKNKYLELTKDFRDTVIPKFDENDIDLEEKQDNDGVVWSENPEFDVTGIATISFKREKNEPTTIKDVTEKYIELMDMPVPISVLKNDYKLNLDLMNVNIDVIEFCLKNQIPILYKHIIGCVELHGIGSKNQDTNIYELFEEFDIEN